MTDHPPPPSATELADEVRDQTLERPAPGTGGSSNDDDQPDDAGAMGTLGGEP